MAAGRELLEQPAVQLHRRLAGGAVAAEVVVRVLVAALQVAPQPARPAEGDGVELAWREHSTTPGLRQAQPVASGGGGARSVRWSCCQARSAAATPWR